MRRRDPGSILLLASLIAVSLSACGGATQQPGPAPPAGPLAELRVRAPIPAGRMPVAVAVGAEAVWVADAGRGTLLKIDPERRRRTGQPIPVGPAPFAVAVGEGAVWVVGQTGQVRAIDPRASAAFGRVARVPDANGLAVGLGGVWVTSRIAGTVTRIDPRTRRADPPIRVGAGAADVVIADGAVWVANSASGTVSRVDPRTRRAGRPIRVGGAVLALAAGDGVLWAGRAQGEFAQQVQVVRLDPRARRLTGRPVPVGGAIPLDLAAGDGSVWATDVGGLRPPKPARPGAVTRIDARRLSVAGAPLETGNRPFAVAVGEGGAWVVNAEDGTVRPITAE